MVTARSGDRQLAGAARLTLATTRTPRSPKTGGQLGQTPCLTTLATTRTPYDPEFPEAGAQACEVKERKEERGGVFIHAARAKPQGDAEIARLGHPQPGNQND